MKPFMAKFEPERKKAKAKKEKLEDEEKGIFVVDEKEKFKFAQPVISKLNKVMKQE